MDSKKSMVIDIGEILMTVILYVNSDDCNSYTEYDINNTIDLIVEKKDDLYR